MTCDRAMARTLSRKRQLRQDIIINNFNINSPCDRGEACLKRGSWMSFLVALGKQRAISNEAGLCASNWGRRWICYIRKRDCEIVKIVSRTMLKDYDISFTDTVCIILDFEDPPCNKAGPRLKLTLVSSSLRHGKSRRCSKRLELFGDHNAPFRTEIF